MKTMSERFWEKVKKTERCWLWTGAAHQEGYGVFNTGSRLIGAHRFSYLETVGFIAEGMEIDHLCRVPACVRPSHLEVVSHSENVKRGTSWHHLVKEARKIKKCPKGHAYSKENTYVTPGKPTRHCKRCVRNRAKEYQRKIQAKAIMMGISSRQYKAIAVAEGGK